MGTIFILTLIFIKYKPAYEVTIEGKKIGYIENLSNFQTKIEEEIINQKEKNIENISLIQEPQYEKKLLIRNTSINEAEIIETLKNEDTQITYNYYKVSLNGEEKAIVDTIDEAEQIVNKIKEEFEGEDLDLDLQINKEYTLNLDDVKRDSLEIAESNVQNAVQEIKEENEAIANVNGIKIACLPVSGKITSRFGESSRLRRSTHTGLDIACSSGTNIKAVASGKIIFAEFNGSYGNLVKIDHGNGIETWYAHCSKIYTNVGKKVEAGDVIAAVGTTGNSTRTTFTFRNKN